jgi:hypothetical protein
LFLDNQVIRSRFVYTVQLRYALQAANFTTNYDTRNIYNNPVVAILKHNNVINVAITTYRCFNSLFMSRNPVTQSVKSKNIDCGMEKNREKSVTHTYYAEIKHKMKKKKIQSSLYFVKLVAADEGFCTVCPKHD